MSSFLDNRMSDSLWTSPGMLPDLSRPNSILKFRLPEKTKHQYCSELSLLLVGSGEVSLSINSRQYHLTPKQFALAEPEDMVALSSYREDIEILVVNIDPSFLKFDKDSLLDGAYPLNGTHLGIRLQDLYERLSVDSLILDQRLMELFARELEVHQKSIMEKIRNIKSVKGSTREEVYRQILKVEVYIEENLNAKIQLSDLCDVAGISRFHFLRKFQEANGISPHQYILRRKVRKSCSLINQHQLTLSEIANQTGLGNIHNFSKVFKRIMGFPPSELRKTG